jgi:hypothetical protein
MFSLILDPKFDNLHLLLSFIGREYGVSIVEEYEKKS